MRQFFGNTPLKSFRLWLLIGFLSYSLGGFLLLPYVVKTQLIKFVYDTLGQQIHLEAASFNPFLLRLRLQNLQLSTPEQSPLLELGELVVDFDTFGLFKRAWQFSNISLSKLEVFAEIDSEGELNLSKLIPPPSDELERPLEESTANALPRLILQNIAIYEGRIHFKQLNRVAPFNLDLNPLNFNIANFSTLPEDGGQLSFHANFSNTETLEFSATLQVEPLAFTGHIALNNIELSRVGDYLEERLLFKIDQGTLSVNSDFTLDKSGLAQSLALQASNIGIALQQLQLHTLPPIEPLLELSSITLNNASFAWPQNSINAESLVIDNGSVHTWLTANKVFNYSQLVKSSTSQVQPDPETETPTESKPLQLHLEQVQLKTLQLNFDDRSLGEPAPQTVNVVDVSLSPFTLEQNAEFDLQAQLTVNDTGTGIISGRVGAMPPMAALTIGLSELPLPPINSYLHDSIKLNLTKGSVDADLQLDYQSEDNKSLALRGDINIKQLDTFDLVDQEKWIHWQNLAIDGLDLQLEPTRLNITSIELTQPYFDAVIFENGETRLSRMLSSSNQPPASTNDSEPALSTEMPSAASSTEADSGSVAIAIAKFKLIDGTMDFKDFNLPLDFATHIHNLHGQAVNISTSSAKPTELILNGNIDQNGKAKINAASQLSSPQAFSEVKLDLSNVDITSASSYSGKFAGYAIDAGTLSLNVDYRIKQGQMVGDNHLLLEHLTLGDTINSPDAVSLPLKLAVALMKDVDGNIDINLPVKGDLNNPEVRIGGIIWKAFTNLLIKIAASPFKIIGGLFEGVDDNNLNNVTFNAGSNALSTNELEDLNKLAQGLQQKPQLALTINACYNPEADRMALQTLQFNTAYQALAGEPDVNFTKASSTPLNYRYDLLAEMYLKVFGNDKLVQLKANIKAAVPTPPTDEQNNIGTPSNIEFLAQEQIQQQLIREQLLDANAITNLASQRAMAILNYLTTDKALPESRIHINVQPIIANADNSGVLCPLILSAL